MAGVAKYDPIFYQQVTVTLNLHSDPVSVLGLCLNPQHVWNVLKNLHKSNLVNHNIQVSKTDAGYKHAYQVTLTFHGCLITPHLFWVPVCLSEHS